MKQSGELVLLGWEATIVHDALPPCILSHFSSDLQLPLCKPWWRGENENDDYFMPMKKKKSREIGGIAQLNLQPQVQHADSCVGPLCFQ